MNNIANGLEGIIGHVPTIRLNRVHPVCTQQDLFLKLEACNPGGSIKEKNAIYLVQDAIKSGKLKPGGTIIEASSGNFGIGLAMVGAALGYKVIIVVDATIPPSIRRIISAHGTQLVEISFDQADIHGSMQIARMKKANELAQTIPGAWYACQHLNPDNPLAHSEFTAKEIVNDFGGSAPDAIVIGVSTSGQLTGIGSFFRAHFPKTKLIAVDADGSAVFGTPRRSYKMTGMGLSFTPPQFNHDYIDEAYLVDDELSFSMCRIIASQEGLLLGASTGAIVAAGLSYACRQSTRQKILMINPDHGDRYLETIYNDEWMKKQKLKVLDKEQCAHIIEKLIPVDGSYFKPLAQSS
ncbi:MAG: PLP-dependent cysteine synthase family protein [Legionellales bacterium]|jgi:cysteine synthase A